MEHGTLGNNKIYCDIFAVNAGTYIQVILLILMTTRGTAVSCDT